MAQKKKFILLELILIIVFVGAISTLYLTWSTEQNRKEKLGQAVQNVMSITQKLRATPMDQWAEYETNDDQMIVLNDRFNIDDPNFTYVLQKDVIVAESTPKYGKANVIFKYMILEDMFYIPDNKHAQFIDKDMLP